MLRRIEIHRVITARTIQATLLSLEPGEKTEPWRCPGLSFWERASVWIGKAEQNQRGRILSTKEYAREGALPAAVRVMRLLESFPGT